MTDLEVLIDWLADLAQQFHQEVEALSDEELAWQPDAEANTIGVTVWHVGRWLDVLAHRVLRAGPAEDELWHTRGWRDQTHYDPRGLGYQGLGAITDYTLAEAKAIPLLAARELLAYFDQSCEALRHVLLTLSPEALHQPAPGLGGKHSIYKWVKVEWQGFFGHVGEIQAIRAMYARQRR